MISRSNLNIGVITFRQKRQQLTHVAVAQLSFFKNKLQKVKILTSFKAI
jgi:hypothetical protein